MRRPLVGGGGSAGTSTAESGRSSAENCHLIVLQGRESMLPSHTLRHFAAQCVENLGGNRSRIEPDEQSHIGKLKVHPELAQGCVPEFETVRTTSARLRVGLAAVRDRSRDLGV